MSSINSIVSPIQATGSRIDFASTSVLSSAYTNIVTMPSSATFANIVHNGGGEFYLQVNSTDVGFITPGMASYIPMKLATGDTINIKSVSGTVSSGKLWVNLYK